MISFRLKKYSLQEKIFVQDGLRNSSLSQQNSNNPKANSIETIPNDSEELPLSFQKTIIDPVQRETEPRHASLINECVKESLIQLQRVRRSRGQQTSSAMRTKEKIRNSATQGYKIHISIIKSGSFFSLSAKG